MQIKVMACLPCVAVESDVVDLGGSRIVHLPFEDWLALEGQSRSAPYNKLDGRYSRNPPAFWKKTIEVETSLVADRGPASVRLLSGLVEDDIEILVKALHWYTGTAPIHPLRSVIYFDARSEENFAAVPGLKEVIADGGVQRQYGESEKEYATQNESPTILLRPADTLPLASMVDFSRQTQPVWTDERYDMASQSLGLCSTPGLDWQSQILLLVGAYESLLLPDLTTGLQVAFQRRFAGMAALCWGDIERYVAWFKTAYQLRSDLIHGRSLTNPRGRLPLTPAQYVSALARAGVVALCRLIRYRHAHPRVEEWSDPLWAALDAAGASPEGFSALQRLIGVATVAPLRHQWDEVGAPC